MTGGAGELAVLAAGDAPAAGPLRGTGIGAVVQQVATRGLLIVRDDHRPAGGTPERCPAGGSAEGDIEVLIGIFDEVIDDRYREGLGGSVPISPAKAPRCRRIIRPGQGAAVTCGITDTDHPVTPAAAVRGNGDCPAIFQHRIGRRAQADGPRRSRSGSGGVGEAVGGGHGVAAGVTYPDD